MRSLFKIALCTALGLILTANLLPGGTYDLGPSLQLRHKGSLHNVFTTSRTMDFFGPTRTYIYDIQRVRTDWLAVFKRQLRLAVVYDHELRTGSYLGMREYSALKTFSPPELINLDSGIMERRNLVWRHRLYRVYAEWDRYPVRLTAGRQQVSWGTGYFWNPTDLFNPVTFALVEPDERHGVDAASLELSLGTLSQVHAVWAPGRNPRQGRGAVRLKTNVHDYDFSVIGGWFFRDRIMGADFSGQIRGAGFRGEWLHNFAWRKAAYDQMVLGADYRFRGGVTLIGEYLYNSGALSESELLRNLSLAQVGSVMTLSRHLAGLYLDYQAHPLVHLTGYMSVDLEKGGLFLGPRVSWNILTDLDLEAGALMAAGGGEYSIMKNAFYLNTSWYF